MAKLRKISSRAEITSTGLTNTYQWGDFKGDPRKLMERHFDAFLDFANWGTHRLMFRVPCRLLDVAMAEAYCFDAADEGLSLRAGKEHVVLEFHSEDESGDGDWSSDEGLMASLIGLRDELMRGDHRALYLGWLSSLGIVDWEDDDAQEGPAGPNDRPEPPVPPGLERLTAAQRALAEFLLVGDEVIQVAAAGSSGEPPAEPLRADLARWTAGLPAAAKDVDLLRFFAEKWDIPLRAELARRYRESTAPPGETPAATSGPRTVVQLLAARDALVAEAAPSPGHPAEGKSDRKQG